MSKKYYFPPLGIDYTLYMIPSIHFSELMDRKSLEEIPKNPLFDWSEDGVPPSIFHDIVAHYTLPDLEALQERPSGDTPYIGYNVSSEPQVFFFHRLYEILSVLISGERPIGLEERDDEADRPARCDCIENASEKSEKELLRYVVSGACTPSDLVPDYYDGDIEALCPNLVRRVNPIFQNLSQDELSDNFTKGEEYYYELGFDVCDPSDNFYLFDHVADLKKFFNYAADQGAGLLYIYG